MTSAIDVNAQLRKYIQPAANAQLLAEELAGVRDERARGRPVQDELAERPQDEEREEAAHARTR